MVDLSLVHAMATPPDPFSLKLQQHNSTNPNPNSNINPWGTWEELLLGSAVLKHGADNWALVSAELQSRAKASFSFTPEACRAGYQAIKLRFGADGGRDGSTTRWYEELRRLRVAHLKRELEQCDTSIGSLENKIKRLQSEEEGARGKNQISDLESSKFARERPLTVAVDTLSACARANSCHPLPGIEESNKGPHEPTFKLVVHESHVCDTEKLRRDMAEGFGGEIVEPKDGLVLNQSSLSDMTEPSNKKGASALWSNGVENPVPNNTSVPSVWQCNGVMESTFNDNGASKGQQPLSSSSTLQMSISNNDASTIKSATVDQGLVGLNTQLTQCPVGVEQKVGGLEYRTAEVLKRSYDAVDCNPTTSVKATEHYNSTTSNDVLSDGRGVQSEATLKGPHPPLTSQTDVSFNLTVDAVQGGEIANKGEVSPSLKSVNIEECKLLARGEVGAHGDNGEEKSEQSESLCSPRPKASPTHKRRWSPGFSREACPLDDDDDKRQVRKVVAEKGSAEPLSSLAVESADSTEGKGQEALHAKTLGLEPLTIKVKKEIACKEEDRNVPGSGAVKAEGEHSTRLGTGPLNTEGSNHSPSSTENSLLHEVWGESVEAVDKEMKRASKRRRLLGWERKRKATTFDTAGHADVRGTKEPPRQVEFSVKTESTTNSHEDSESMHSPVGKMENDTEAWHHVERLSGDSRFEKSEVGSYVDGNEDISPMSRRHRREPKVSGKLIPLLESLRAICAHRCAPFFRHNQEPEENDVYYRTVRMPIDLGMIRAKLEEGQYTGSMHFFRDLLLMVNNALVYHPRDSSEFAAAFGLRGCVVKEMGHVFETEVLVKQEGPSFRKRDARQLATTNQGRRKGSRKLLLAMDKPLRDLAVKQSEASTSVDSRRHSQQNVVSQSEDGGARGVDAKKHIDSLEGKRLSDLQSTPEGSNGLRLGPSPFMKAHTTKELGMKLGSSVEKGNQTKKHGSDKLSIGALSKDAKLKHRLVDSGARKRSEMANVGSTSKSTVMAPSKGIENSGRKLKAVPADGVLEPPVKRGVGRPPKHSQHHGVQKAREVEMPNMIRKRGRR